MKNSIVKISSIALLSVIFCVTFYACDSDQELRGVDEDLFVEEDIEELSDAYSAVFLDIFHALKQEYKQISGSDIDITRHFERFAESYTRNTRYSDSYIPRDPDGSKGVIKVSDEFLDKIKPIMLDEDLSLLKNEINEFYNSPYFLSLNNVDRQELRIQLESLIKIRDCVTEIVIDYAQNGNSMTRMSPGDRMVWSEAMKILNDSQRRNAADAVIIGIALVTTGPMAGIVTLAAWAASFF